MSADRAGAIGDAAFARREKQSGGVHRARRKDDDPSRYRFAFPGNRSFYAGDALAVWTQKQPIDASVFAQLDVAIGKSFVETAGLRVHLASPRVGEGVPRRFRAR